jgi:hypothetical protein
MGKIVIFFRPMPGEVVPGPCVAFENVTQDFGRKFTHDPDAEDAAGRWFTVYRGESANYPKCMDYGVMRPLINLYDKISKKMRGNVNVL